MADDFKVDDNVFISMDLCTIGSFIDDAKKMTKDFENLKDRFNSINKALIDEWDGEGRDEYEKEANSILEKIGSLGDVLKEITDGTISELRESFSEFDDKLGKFNEDPSAESEE